MKTTTISKTTTDEEAVAAEATVEVAKMTRVKEGINSMMKVVEGEEVEEEAEVDVVVINKTKEEKELNDVIAKQEQQKE